MNTQPFRLRASTRGLAVLALVLSVLLPVAATAAPNASVLAGPCVPGAAYDPACDVDHDGDVDIFDIQLTAGRWNQAGTWISDNDHNHLGQTWTGNNNPLKIQGTFGNPDSAPLVLSNSTSTGHGLRISSAGNTGVYINSAGNHGVYVGTVGGDGFSVNFPDGDGLSVGSADQHGVNVTQAFGNGINVDTAEGYGVRLDVARDGGFFVCRAGNVGECTPSTTFHGLEVGNAQGDGVRITDAAGDGIQIGDGTNFPNNGLRIPSPGTPGDALVPNTSDALGQWALFTTDDIQAGNVFLSGLTLVGVVGDGSALSPGDVVAAAGMAGAIPGGRTPLAQVRLATGEQANIAGVVLSRMALRPLPGATDDSDAGDQDLRSVAGPAQPGDYVAITVLGAAQVKVQDGETLVPGQRVTVGANGAARALETRMVEGMEVSEGAATVGAVLEAPKDGMVWMLVNPQ